MPRVSPEGQNRVRVPNPFVFCPEQVCIELKGTLEERSHNKPARGACTYLLPVAVRGEAWAEEFTKATGSLLPCL